VKPGNEESEGHFVFEPLWEKDGRCLQAKQDVKAHVNIRRVLTKKLFMFIIHRITIQRHIRYNLGFVLSYSVPQFPRESHLSHGNCLLTKSWSSVF
jgi:hypothetical protein